jgi:hypothetical protein
MTQVLDKTSQTDNTHLQSAEDLYTEEIKALIAAEAFAFDKKDSQELTQARFSLLAHGFKYSPATGESLSVLALKNSADDADISANTDVCDNETKSAAEAKDGTNENKNIDAWASLVGTVDKKRADKKVPRRKSRKLKDAKSLDEQTAQTPIPYAQTPASAPAVKEPKQRKDNALANTSVLAKDLPSSSSAQLPAKKPTQTSLDVMQEPESVSPNHKQSSDHNININVEIPKEKFQIVLPNDVYLLPRIEKSTESIKASKIQARLINTKDWIKYVLGLALGIVLLNVIYQWIMHPEWSLIDWLEMISTHFSRE